MKLTKEECEKALKRFAKPFQASIDVQKIYYDCNGEEYSINEDCYLLFKLINEHFELVKENELLKRENKALADDNEMKCDAIAELKRKVKWLETTNSRGTR